MSHEWIAYQRGAVFGIGRPVWLLCKRCGLVRRSDTQVSEVCLPPPAAQSVRLEVQ